NHFSKWFKARTEFALAHELRPRKVSDFATIGDLRHELMRAVRAHRERSRRGVVVDFNPDTFTPETTLNRLGGGSLGGKARGLAFVDLVLNESRVRERFPGIGIGVPSAVVVGTDVFDEFLEQ